MKTVEIYFHDLTPKAQAYLLQELETAEDDENWEISPLAIIEREEEIPNNGNGRNVNVNVELRLIKNGEKKKNPIKLVETEIKKITCPYCGGTDLSSPDYYSVAPSPKNCFRFHCNSRGCTGVFWVKYKAIEIIKDDDF